MTLVKASVYALAEDGTSIELFPPAPRTELELNYLGQPELKMQSMPSISQFKRFDVRPLLQRGEDPLPEILKLVQALKTGDGLITVAPFLPSPLIELLGSQGFQSKIERGKAGAWIVYFWRASG